MKIRQSYCHMDGVTQEKVLNPAQRLGDSGRTGGAGSPHHGLRRGQPSSPRPSSTPEVEGHLFGLLLGSSEPRPAHYYEAVRR